ncbi:MAG TPA: cytochrome b/b6 domain-containing protein [Burkholderiales bacterium]|nr:cytochrome b/b6 domain-containing protein [Burkholderiales bacterium]
MASSDSNPRADRRAQVWDLPVRLFHWALVLLLISQIVTASIGGNAMEYHKLGGYAILTLVLFRLAWGVLGTRHARFADFVRGPRAVVEYARVLLAGGHRAYPGHNPLGGWSVMLMLASLLVQTGTGLFADDEIMTTGPLEKYVTDDTASLLTAIHEINAAVLVALVVVHVAAVLYYLVGRKENLIRPMITGRKDWIEPVEDPPSEAAIAAKAVALLALSGLAVFGLVNL